ncbi:hypothetical protein FOXYSP1_03808 [Fusarium oxysporum f. sp. phaseoli]
MRARNVSHYTIPDGDLVMVTHQIETDDSMIDVVAVRSKA